MSLAHHPVTIKTQSHHPLLPQAGFQTPHQWTLVSFCLNWNICGTQFYSVVLRGQIHGQTLADNCDFYNLQMGTLTSF